MNNKELAKKALDDIIEQFNGMDIKYTNKSENGSEGEYTVTIVNNGYDSFLDDVKNNWELYNEVYLQYTEFGLIQVSFEENEDVIKMFTITSFYENNENDEYYESLISIKEDPDIDWEYWEMPDNYKGNEVIPHYFKAYSDRYVGYVYVPYESEIDENNITEYTGLIYDYDTDSEINVKTFSDLEAAKKYVDSIGDELIKDDKIQIESKTKASIIPIKEKNNDEKIIYEDDVNINMNVVITESSNGEYYNIYVDNDPTLFLQEPKDVVKNLELTALDAVIDYYKSKHFSDTDY